MSHVHLQELENGLTMQDYLKNEHIIQTFGLLTRPKLDNTRVSIIVATLSQAFIASCNSHNKFKRSLKKMHGKVVTIKLDKETINSHDVSRFYEWDNISSAKYSAGNNISVLTSLRREMPCCSTPADTKP